MSSWQSEAARKKTGAPYAGDGLRATARCRGGGEDLLTRPALWPHVRKRQARRCLENGEGNEQDLGIYLPIGRTGVTGDGFCGRACRSTAPGRSRRGCTGNRRRWLGHPARVAECPRHRTGPWVFHIRGKASGDSLTGQRVINRIRVRFSCLRGRPGPEGIRRSSVIVDRAVLEFLLLHLQPAASGQGALLSAERPEERPGSSEPHGGAGNPNGLD